jgi:FkbM family methyltransferase
MMPWNEIVRMLGSFQAMKVTLLEAMGFDETILRLPDGMRIIIDLSQAPSVLDNLLHVYYHMDYAFTPEAFPKPGWRVIDVGAYLGAFTLWSVRRVGQGGEVIALEPHPASRAFLERTIKLNNLYNVRILPYALSAHDGKGILYSPRYRALASLKRDHPEYFCGEVLEEYEVECVSLRTLLNMVECDEIDLLKLDIEGLEYDVLKHSISELSSIRRILVEVHLNACSIPKLDKLLKDNGFETIIKFDTRAENQAFMLATRKS